MILPSLVKHDHQRFDYIGEDRAYYCDASSLGRPGVTLFNRVYDDACDVGFAMVKSNGESVVFTLDEDASGTSEGHEVSDWTFRPTAEAVAKHPKLAGCKVVIFNT